MRVSPFVVMPGPALNPATSPVAAPVFGRKKGGGSPDDAQAAGLLMILSVVVGLPLLAALGVGKYWHSHSHFSMGGSLRTMQKSVDTFQAAKDLPSKGKTEFTSLLERAQEQVAAHKTQPGTEQIKSLVPILTSEDTQALDKMMAEAGTVTRAQDLMPLFSQWLDILDKHSEQKLDKAGISQDAERYFSNLKGHSNIQWGFMIALIAAAAIPVLGVGQALKR